MKSSRRWYRKTYQQGWGREKTLRAVRVVFTPRCAAHYCSRTSHSTFVFAFPESTVSLAFWTFFLIVSFLPFVVRWFLPGLFTKHIRLLKSSSSFKNGEHEITNKTGKRDKMISPLLSAANLILPNNMVSCRLIFNRDLIECFTLHYKRINDYNIIIIIIISKFPKNKWSNTPC